MIKNSCEVRAFVNGYSRTKMFRIILAITLVAHEATALKLRDVSVPVVAIKGDPVRLNCTFDLEGDKLYSVKWHKDNVEFYRYVPDNRPSAQRYELEGIYLDLYKCKEGNIYMYTTDVNSEGIYRCEVSTDTPSFQTVKGEGEMRIYVFPSEGPRVIGVQQRYMLGDEVNVSCIASPSRPAAFLKWYINGKEAPGEYLRRRESIETTDGLQISTLGLKFVADGYHFPADGNMKLKCEAIISQAHTLISEELIIPQNASDAKSWQTHSNSESYAPRIQSGRLHYQVGEMVDFNCTAARSQPPAELHWYINDKAVRPENTIPYPAIVYADGQESTILGLRFQAKQRHFQKGQMRLRCTAAALSEVARMASPTVEVSVKTHRQQVSGLHVYQNARSISNTGRQIHGSRWSLWMLAVLALITKL